MHVEDGRFVIQVVEPGRARAGAMRWIRQFYGRELRRVPVEFQTAERSFADLMSWYRTFQNVVFEHGAIWTDIRESANRLEAGLEPASDFPAARRALTEAGVPGDIYVLIPDRAAISNKDLDDRFRPVLGGVNVDGCTLGFNVRHWDVGRGFVTAGHCTETLGVTNDEVFAQPGFNDLSDRVGVETVDPPFWTGTNSITGDTCPSWFTGGCRYSDAALVAYDVGVSDTLAEIARPGCVNCSDGQLVVDEEVPTLTLVDEVHVLAEGEAMGKIGNSTGWTTGTIDKTCTSENLDEYDALIMADLYPPILASFANSKSTVNRSSQPPIPKEATAAVPSWTRR